MVVASRAAPITLAILSGGLHGLAGHSWSVCQYAAGPAGCAMRSHSVRTPSSVLHSKTRS